MEWGYEPLLIFNLIVSASHLVGKNILIPPAIMVGQGLDNIVRFCITTSIHLANIALLEAWERESMVLEALHNGLKATGGAYYGDRIRSLAK